jgi:hypothetical protein
LILGSFLIALSTPFVAADANSVISGAMVLASGGQHHAPALKSGCDRLTLDKTESRTPMFAGNPSTLVYACGKAGRPAFTTEKTSSGSTPFVTPIFSSPSGWTVSVGISRDNAECSTGDKLVALTSGTPIKLHSGSGYVYCVTAASASNFTSFNISWV